MSSSKHVWERYCFDMFSCWASSGNNDELGVITGCAFECGMAKELMDTKQKLR